MSIGDAPAAPATRDQPSEAAVLDELRRMIEEILGAEGLDDIVELTRDTRLLSDLQLESVDLVTLATRLEARYGDRVNFAEFVADLDLDHIIELSAGQLVDYVAGCLRETGSPDPAPRER